MTATPRALAALRHQISQIEAGNRVDRGVLPFGTEEMDQRLPSGGLALGGLHEVAGGANGALDGAAAALFAAGIVPGPTGPSSGAWADGISLRLPSPKWVCIPTG